LQSCSASAWCSHFSETALPLKISALQRMANAIQAAEKGKLSNQTNLESVNETMNLISDSTLKPVQNIELN